MAKPSKKKEVVRKGANDNRPSRKAWKDGKSPEVREAERVVKTAAKKARKNPEE
jgi:hypothetical protein